ncbi:putative gliotoxin biosynthesis protein GliK [Colletotrichum karsti]|uniref:gamma-glutamylcyclotransferase n=1 Tax=Colletotrichum karsti TaxID=1095194 RepID=A0A9P6I0I6_9PEZI|nr:putative gliotoxin biosynthesis protein GliK [Colletotrichum karsti]KAF9873834.1 putative gliotoxin biosynthesis protein GliK [Colletotrichum karsti]
MATGDPTPLLRQIHETSFLSPPKRSSYPPISSIPRTSPERLAAAAEDTAQHAKEDIAAGDGDQAEAEKTILYLAYGSNLSAETFLGARGIRPVSQTNVSAPSLTLVFDLPGLPYREPCFANTAPRKVPEIPRPPGDPRFPPLPAPPPPPSEKQQQREYDVEGQMERESATPDRGWTKGLYGVVYEVTPRDYATIVATEGGGSSYADILVPCVSLPPRVSVPEKPPIDIPRPFLAHTLYSPAIPDAEPEKPGRGQSTYSHDGDDTPEDPRKKWYYRLIKPPRRPDPNYAQPSARYLKLITDGAAEHELPDDYQRWLNGLAAYTVTTWRQRVARWLLTGLFLPVMLVFFQLNKWLADKEGKFPLWLGVGLSVVFNLLWMAYDGVLKPVFGDGERTEEEGERRWRRVEGSEFEKRNLLLGDW